MKLSLTTALLALALLVGAGQASAASCARQVVNDWYGNGRVDGKYPIHCYRDAIKILPEDVRQYASAADDIRRDMLLAIRGQRPGGGKPTKKGNGNNQGPTSSNGQGPTSGGALPGGGGKGGGPTAGPTAGPSNGIGNVPDTGAGNGTKSAGPDKGLVDRVFGSFGPKNADSIPLPLLILAGVALLLLLAGAASFFARRMQARKVAIVTAPPPRPPRP